MPNPAEFKALNGEVARFIRIEPNRIGPSWNSVRLDVVANYSEIVKNVLTSDAKANILPDRYAKNVTSLIWFGSVVVSELEVELMCSNLDCAALAYMLGRREDVVDRAKASNYERHDD